jgi:hypothetical protein
MQGLTEDFWTWDSKSPGIGGSASASTRAQNIVYLRVTTESKTTTPWRGSGRTVHWGSSTLSVCLSMGLAQHCASVSALVGRSVSRSAACLGAEGRSKPAASEPLIRHVTTNLSFWRSTGA